MTPLVPLRLCLVGLPDTGKTTYIAALWGYLISGLPPGGYRVTEFPDDPAYLSQIAAAWAAGDPMPRNSLGASDRIEFTVQSPSGAKVTLVLPDLPGEVFRNAILRPFIDEDTAEAVTGSDLLLLFVNGEKAKTFTALGDFEVIAASGPDAEIGSAPDSLQGSADDAPSNPAEPGEAFPAIAAEPARKDFAIQDLDSDTLNTELLQRLVHLTRDTGLPCLAVVVSAWDAHRNSGDTPSQWLAREQPMLSQLIDELSRATPVGVVGVSAQGANYVDDPNITSKLADERPWGCDQDGNETDIAGPLLWHDTAGSAKDG